MPFTEMPELAPHTSNASGRINNTPDSLVLKPQHARRRAIHRALAVGVLSTALVASVGLGGGAAAAAPIVTCGSTVTTDVTLTADLHCPAGDGIILEPNVTLDLGGHKLIGPGSSGVGVQTNPSSETTSGNVIRNGIIANWESGIILRDSKGAPHTVSDVVLYKSPVSHLFGETTLQLTRITAVSSRIGGELGGDLAISDSRLLRSEVNVFFAGATITDSTLVQSPTNSGASGGIIIESSRLNGLGKTALGYISETSLTINNSAVRNFSEPITGFWGAVTLTNSSFANMPNGVLGNINSNIGSDGLSEIIGNSFLRSGIVLRGNVPMVVENNTFKQNEIGVEFTRWDPFPDDSPLTNDGSRATGNVFTKNTGSGLTTDLPGLEVGDNTATKNGGYGIYAPAAVDLGGNVAYGNVLGQCVGVACSGG